MRKNANIEINGFYTCKVTKKVTTIQILASTPKGGWEAVNTATGKKIHVKGPEHLIEKVDGPKAKPEKPEPTAPQKKPVKPKTESKLSLLDAAAVVLKTESPLNCRQMIEKMAAANLWASSAATPANTLSAAIAKEIRVKGDESRFAKVERGQFALNTV